jgi:hypothetical protein
MHFSFSLHICDCNFVLERSSWNSLQCILLLDLESPSPATWLTCPDSKDFNVRYIVLISHFIPYFHTPF